MLNMKVKVKKFATYACIPQKATLVSAGFDLYSARVLLLEARKLQKIETDIAFQFSPKFTCRINLYSSMSLKDIVSGSGVIDSDFRENISVILINTSDRTVEIEVGDRIAEIFFPRKEDVKFEEVKELDHTERGVGGFGSTGKQKK